MSRSTRVGFDHPRDGRVSARVFDVSGRSVRTLADRSYSAARHELVWDGHSDRGAKLPAGVYFCRIRTGGLERSTTLSLVSR